MAAGTRPRVDPRAIARLLLAHHPRCHPYRHDVYRLGGLELCMGCFTAYPIALGLLVPLLLLAPGPWWLYLTAGLSIGTMQGLAILGWTRTRRRKLVVKVALGIGLAGTVYGIVAAPWSLGARLAASAAGLILAGVLMIPRGVRMRRTCANCFYQGDWERCIGFRLIAPPRALPPETARVRHRGHEGRAPSPID
jgi:hypothetical protein